MSAVASPQSTPTTPQDEPRRDFRLLKFTPKRPAPKLSRVALKAERLAREKPGAVPVFEGLLDDVLRQKP